MVAIVTFSCLFPGHGIPADLLQYDAKHVYKTVDSSLKVMSTQQQVTHFVLKDAEGLPYVYIDNESSRFLMDRKIPEGVDLSTLTILAFNSFKKIEAMVVQMNEFDLHCVESLKGKQKYCVLCKYVGRKTNEGIMGVRTRTKCCACDLPLCKGFPRNCFKITHELFKLLKYPNLQCSLTYSWKPIAQLDVSHDS